MKRNQIGETKKIFTKSIALELRRRGFKIIGTEPNEKFPQFDVYIFQSNNELETALMDILKARSGSLKN